MSSISELIKKKKEVREIEVPNIQVVDLNKPLILSLFAIDVYGKDGNDEEVIRVIIGGGVSKSRLEVFERCWDEASQSKKFKKGKDGRYYDGDMRVLRPITR